MELSRQLSLHPLVARVLVARGVVNPLVAKRFLSPRLADLTHPDAMADRALAADRLVRAIRARERVVVFGDYDVDGITSAALLTRVLRSLGADVKTLVASRFDGGYGLSDTAVDRALALGPGVVVTCDCGTSDHARLERLRAKGVDAIVVDHHKVPEEKLPALAFLNPHRPECAFPYKHMASVGLAFSIAAAVRAGLGVNFDMRALLDLVALGTIADVAPLDGDNRILTRAGIDRIADGHANAGVRALQREARMRYRFTSRDVGWTLGPMLNAPGRLGAATPTLELLLADDDREASRLAADLADANTRRRAISAELIDAALKQAREVYGAALPPGIVLAGDGWHPGMGGIVAGRLVDRLGVAVTVVALDGDKGVGSVRAPSGTKLYDAVSACRDELMVFGGHDGAAGLSVRRERIEAFRAAFARAVGSAPRGTSQAPRADTELFENDLVPPLARDLRALEPTGEGNPETCVIARDVRVTDVRVVGEVHLRLVLNMGRRTLGGFVRDGVSRRERGEIPAVGAKGDVTGTLRPDPFNGPDAVQVEVESFSGLPH
jgi:single-stranded-DNA-specific exonuclease